MGTGGLFEDPPAVSGLSVAQDASEAASASPKRGESHNTRTFFFL